MPEVLNYYQLGKGPVDLLLLHGLAADSGFWLPLVGQVDTSKYTIHLLDLKGHGKSSFHNTNFLPSVLSQEVIEACDRMDLNHYILVSHSYGGRVGLNMLMSAQSMTAPSQLLILDTYWPEFQERPTLQSVLARSTEHNNLDPSGNQNVPVSATQSLNLMRARVQKSSVSVKKQKRTKNLLTWEQIIADEELCRTIDSQVDERVDLNKAQRLGGKIKLFYGDDSLFLASGKQASKELGLKLHIIPNARHFFPRFQAGELAELINDLKV
jgi:pimeloyl-ACP methyl ester carboxylesterase